MPIIIIVLAGLFGAWLFFIVFRVWCCKRNISQTAKNELRDFSYSIIFLVLVIIPMLMRHIIHNSISFDHLSTFPHNFLFHITYIFMPLLHEMFLMLGILLRKRHVFLIFWREFKDSDFGIWLFSLTEALRLRMIFHQNQVQPENVIEMEQPAAIMHI